MIHLRDFKKGRPEAERSTLCGRPASEVPTTGGNLAWWKGRAVKCAACWDAWQGTLEKIMGARP